ncbi:hypothetical protein M569_11560, partial [Genlisea aurea]
SMDILTTSNSLPLFFLGFSALYYFAYSQIFRRWPPNIRPGASSCAISLAHGTPAAVLAYFAIVSDPTHDFHSRNTRFQNAVLDYSVAYFLTDLLHYVVFSPGEVLFVAHHLATLFVFLTCRFVVLHGAYAILGLLILAEMTSLLQNVWTLAGLRRSDLKSADRLYGLVSPVFYGAYSVARGLIGPLFVFRMSVFYLSGGADGFIPKWASVSWLIVVAVAISVSISWIFNLWVEFFRER